MDREEKQPEMKKDGQKVKEATRKDEKVTAKGEEIEGHKGCRLEKEKEKRRSRKAGGEEMVRGGGDDGQRGERKRCNLMK